MTNAFYYAGFHWSACVDETEPGEDPGVCVFLTAALPYAREFDDDEPDPLNDPFVYIWSPPPRFSCHLGIQYAQGSEAQPAAEAFEEIEWCDRIRGADPKAYEDGASAFTNVTFARSMPDGQLVTLRTLHKPGCPVAVRDAKVTVRIRDMTLL